MATFSTMDLQEIRRDLHERPEVGWTEFRTTALLADALDDLGYELHLGSDALDPDQRLGLPDEGRIEAAEQRARDAGAPAEYLDAMDGITGLVAERTFGDGSGPVVGVRVDIDALEIEEADDDEHHPAREGFRSVHEGEMHACAHDGHATIGLGIAREFVENGGFDGTLKLFFQPSEEGGRGGLPMSETPLLEDVEYMLALHLGLGHETGTVVASYERPLSNAKLDVTFLGEPAHAGGAPQEGRNALQAATTAIQNCYAIPRHSDGVTRVNVGKVHSPNPQNVIPDRTTMRVEVRGRTADLNEYMLDRVRSIVDGAATAHDVDVETSLYGKTTTFEGDDALVDVVSAAARESELVESVTDREDFGGSEDASFLIRRVQRTGGQGIYLGVGASNPDGHHTSYFDIDEESIDVGVDVVSRAIRSL